MKLFIIDAFTEKAFGGNPAGVVLCEHEPSLDTMINLAAELRFSETAFVKQMDDLTYNIRYFTPNSEVDLCGHATIAAFSALEHVGLAKKGKNYNILTAAGRLEVQVSNESIMLEQAVPISGDILSSKEDLENICACLNLSEDHIGDLKYDLKMQIISTGLYDIILPVKSRHILNAITIDPEKLAEFSRKKAVVGVHAFTLDCDEALASCRNFAPLYGINEEAATGTSNGALTHYLYLNDLIEPSSKILSFIQGEKMNRPSIIKTQLLKSHSGLKIFVGGNAKIISFGELYL